MAQMSELMTLKSFFGNRPGSDNSLKAFADECKALSAEAKAELARLAKAEMLRVGSHKAEDFAF
jgi:hypothetical protein